MDETYGTYVVDQMFDMHDCDDDTDDDTKDDTDDDTDGGGRGNRRPLPGGAELISQMMTYDETLILDFVLSRSSGCFKFTKHKCNMKQCSRRFRILRSWC